MRLNPEAHGFTSDKLVRSARLDGTGATTLLASCATIRSEDMNRSTTLLKQMYTTTNLVRKLEKSTLDVRVLLNVNCLIQLAVSSLGPDSFAAIASWHGLAKEASFADSRASSPTPDDTLSEIIKTLWLNICLVYQTTRSRLADCPLL
ncbi:hypothetical protein GQ607_017277 [Colletotrichum asianum]|uniref:Uncharacterized protein n=1 Tax=Colletotrichum asianum TaxID=702518 RepID=A0A8H3VZE7_9PEZI|nr:hypothetical protein GQ607_017277 [Colletotrichum asianum]